MKHTADKISKRTIPAALPVVLVAIGLILLLYPTVANQINRAANGKAIEEYRKTVDTADTSEQERLMSAVQDYNAYLAEYMPYLADLPKEKRELYESLLNVDGNGIIGYLEIPKINVYLAIYHGTDESVLQNGAGHVDGSSLPAKGESVHTVLIGHTGLPSARLFTDLDQLKVGDTFTLYVLNETLTYRVEDVSQMPPESLQELKIESGQELCSLVTCAPYGVNNQRLTVTGRRFDEPADRTP